LADRDRHVRRVHSREELEKESNPEGRREEKGDSLGSIDILSLRKRRVTGGDGKSKGLKKGGGKKRRTLKLSARARRRAEADRSNSEKSAETEKKPKREVEGRNKAFWKVQKTLWWSERSLQATWVGKTWKQLKRKIRSSRSSS